ncbi:MAG: response regulator [Phycisphaeraceae bacterium]|nr:MAG: response regulator [Phycisphaeraceae bacterium]
MSSSPESKRPVRFLLVEDDEDHADLIQRAMRENRVANELAHVADGESAIAYLQREGEYASATRPDVILLDLKLPRLDGHEVLKKIKANPDLTSIPVVMLTTSAAEVDKAQAYSLHVNSYVVKPIDFDCFNDIVQNLNFYWAVVNEAV